VKALGAKPERMSPDLFWDFQRPAGKCALTDKIVSDDANWLENFRRTEDELINDRYEGVLAMGRVERGQ
jgi:hypothetical protein